MSAPGSGFSRRQRLLLLGLTLVWGLNWPVMKLGVGGMPPLSFRSVSLVIALPLLYALTRRWGISLAVPRRSWPELGRLTLGNMFVWNVLAIVAIQALSSGRAAILGYTMPIFSALWGIALYRERLSGRQWIGIAAAAVGIALLIWHELGVVASRPFGAALMLVAAAVWGLGTQQVRRTRIGLPTLTLAWWMTLLTALGMGLMALLTESVDWAALSVATWAAILYNAFVIFGFAQPVWLLLARSVPPAASTLSVMMIPVLGTLSGAWWLGETLHWQDGVALLLMGVALGTVLWPPRRADAGAGAEAPVAP